MVLRKYTYKTLMHSVDKMIILLYDKLPKNKLIMVKKRDLLNFYKNNNYTFIRCFCCLLVLCGQNNKGHIIQD